MATADTTTVSISKGAPKTGAASKGGVTAPSQRQQEAINKASGGNRGSSSNSGVTSPSRNAGVVQRVYPTPPVMSSSVPATEQVTPSYQSPETIVASNPNIVASSRNQGEYISSSGSRVTPIASYQAPASGYQQSPGVITRERPAPVQSTRPVSDFRRVGSGYEPAAAKVGGFLQSASDQGYAFAEQQEAKGGFVNKAVALGSRGVAFSAGAVASPFQRYAVTDKTLGRDIVLSYGVGKAVGIGAGEFTNFAGRTAAAKFGASAGSKAFTVTSRTIGGVGVGTLALTEYGKSSSEFGRDIPGLVAGGYGAVKGFKASRPGVIVDSVSPVSATRGTTYYEPGVISGSFQQTRVASLTEFGVPKQVRFEANTFLTGNTPRGAGYYNVEATTYGRIPVGKGVPFSETFRGVVTPRGAGLVSQDTGLLFLSRSGKPQLFLSDGVSNAQQVSSRFSVFDIKGSEAKVVRSGRTNTVYDGFDFKQVNAGVARLPTGEAIGLRTQSVVPKSFFESVSGTAEVSGRSIGREAFRSDVFKVLQQENIVRGKGFSFTERLPLGFNKRGSLNVGVSLERPAPQTRVVTPGRFSALDLEGLGVGRSSGLLASPRTPLLVASPASLRSSSVTRQSSGLVFPGTTTAVITRQRTAPSFASPLVTLDVQRQRFSPVTSSRSQFSPSTVSRQSSGQLQIQEPITITPSKPVLRPPTFGTPRSTTPGFSTFPALPGFFPPLGGAGGGLKTRGKRARNSRRYEPSLFAKALNIRGSRSPKSGGFTGLEVRGLLPSRGRSKGKRLKL